MVMIAFSYGLCDSLDVITKLSIASDIAKCGDASLDASRAQVPRAVCLRKKEGVINHQSMHLGVAWFGTDVGNVWRTMT
jgi:hypothetical protein